MRIGDLAVIVHQEIGAVAVQHAGLAAGKRGGMFAALDPVARRLDAVDFDGGIIQEGMEQADGVGAATDRRDQRNPAGAPRLRASAPFASVPITAWKSRTMAG